MRNCVEMSNDIFESHLIMIFDCSDNLVLAKDTSPEQIGLSQFQATLGEDLGGTD